MKKFSHKFLSFMLILAMVFTLVPAFSIVASAETEVSYLSPVYKTADTPSSGLDYWTSDTVNSYTSITSETTDWNWEEGWYVLDGTVTVNGTITVTGAVNLILKDSSSLTVTATNKAGINVSGTGNSLTIYAQSEGNAMGQLNVTGANCSAGIGGNSNGTGENITINGGFITATGSGGASGIGGGKYSAGKNIVINGGVIVATSGSSASAIGGGSGAAGSHITINGGTVIATSSNTNGGAAIGGGWQASGSYITINGGTVTAKTQNMRAACIGGGGQQNGSGDNITISGGTVNAILSETGTEGAGIGGGLDCTGSSITISGGNVTVSNAGLGAGIGGGYEASGNNISITGGNVSISCAKGSAIGSGNNGAASSDITVSTLLKIKADNNNPPTTVISNDGSDLATSLSGKKYALISKKVACKIGTTEYPTLQGGINAANSGDTVVLAEDLEEDVVITSSQSLTIDLNGHVLKGTGNGSVIDNSGKLTITDTATNNNMNYFLVNTDGLWVWQESYSGTPDYTFDSINGLKTAAGAATTDVPASGKIIAISGGCVTRGTHGIYMHPSSVLTMNGGCIIGNQLKVSDDSGAGVACLGKFTMSGGSICGNVDKKYGGGVYIGRDPDHCQDPTSCIFTLTGGRIFGNTAGTCGGGISINGVGTLNLYGGTISGNKCDNGCGGVEGPYLDTTKVTIGGSINITGNISNGAESNLYIYDSHQICVGTDNYVPTSDMNVGVTTQTEPTASSPVAITKQNIEDYSGYFTSDNSKYSVNRGVDNVVELIFVPKATILETGVGYYTVQEAIGAATNGQSVQMVADANEDLTIASSKNITLDLNGYVLSGTGTSCVIKNEGVLTITDSSINTKHYFNYSSTGAWALNSTATSGVSLSNISTATTDGTVVEIQGGCITGGTGYKFYSDCYGGGIYNTGTLIMQSGNVIGNQSQQTGGGVYSNGGSASISLSGCKIIGNYAYTGGGLRIRGNDNSISNATILGNVAAGGGGIYYDRNYNGTLTINACTIQSNRASFGGGIYNDDYADVIIKGQSVIKDNVASNDGGGICNAGYMTIEEGSIIGNRSLYQAGGIATYTKASTLTIGSGTEIKNNVTEGNYTYPSGGLYSWDGPITLSGTIVISGNVNKNASGEVICDSNLCLDGKKASQTVTLSNFNTDSNIGVSTLLETVTGAYKFTENGAIGDKASFTSDSDDYVVKYDVDHLTLTPTTVKISSAITNGTVVVSDNVATTGASVTVTATPNSGYVLDKITVTDANGSEITVTGNQFTMPSESSKLPVTVSASFKQETQSSNSASTYSYGGGSSSTVTIPVSGDKNTVKVSASVSGSTATVKEVTKDEITKLGTGDEVVMDLSGLSKSVTGVIIPKTTFENVAASDAEGLEIKMPNGTSVVFDKEVLSAVASQAGGKDIQLVIDKDSKAESSMTSAQKETVKEMNNAVVLDAYFVSNGKRISDFKGGEAELTAEYPTTHPVRVWYVADSGDKTAVPCTYDGKTARFIVTHFSHYVIEELEESNYTACLKDSTCVLSKFPDAEPKAWYHDGMHFCVENAYINGTEKGLLMPKSSITRAQVCTILWNIAGKPTVNYAMNFTDVNGNEWYAEAIRWAASEGIVKGYETGAFGPKNAVTREQLAQMLYGYAKKQGKGFTGSWMFLIENSDANKISSWANEAMHWTVMKQITTGDEKGLLNPQGTATRAEAAAMIQRFCELEQ